MGISYLDRQEAQQEGLAANGVLQSLCHLRWILSNVEGEIMNPQLADVRQQIGENDIRAGLVRLDRLMSGLEASFREECCRRQRLFMDGRADFRPDFSPGCGE